MPQDVSPEEAALVAAAQRAMAGAYAPYSGFAVGAALRCADGRVFTGANVESAAYSASVCAERVALPAAVTTGARVFTALAVAGSGPGPCFPCGECRQLLFEFAPGLLVLATGADGALDRVLLADLLPHPFALTPPARGPDTAGRHT